MQKVDEGTGIRRRGHHVRASDAGGIKSVNKYSECGECELINAEIQDANVPSKNSQIDFHLCPILSGSISVTREQQKEK